MTHLSRRSLITGAAGAALLAGCNNGLTGTGGETIDARVDASLEFLYATNPGTQTLRDSAAGILVMPLITKAGFGIGGAFGRGALRIGDATVDYYSATQASFGLQIGAQQFAHALFFMTEGALTDFRNSPGWSAGANLEYALKSQADNISVDTTTATSPVIAVVFGQAGLIAGATLAGTKYSRIIP